MDLFKFAPISGTDIKLTNGQIVDGWSSLTWIERYLAPCEFTLETKSADILAKLPLGTLISHTGSPEVMIVENHELTKKRGEEPVIKTTGRSFETFLDHRVMGTNTEIILATSFPIPPVVLPADYTWAQAVRLIQEFTDASFLVNDTNALNFVDIIHTVTGSSYVEARAVKFGELYPELIDILKIDDLGIRTKRPTASNPNLTIEIHQGQDRRTSVAFSEEAGDIDEASYLWSIKNLKNAAMISGKWVSALINGPESGYNKRVMFVDAEEADKDYADVPSGPEISIIQGYMYAKGRMALAAQNAVSISSVKLNNDNLQPKYRQDYNVGDIVGVEGEYNASSAMRVTEYVEIQDENGTSGYPTLSELEE